MTFAAGSPIDPLQYLETAIATGYRDETGKTVVNPAIIPGQRTFCAIVAGQSLAANSQTPPLYNAVHPNNMVNVNPFTSKAYLGADPAIGPSSQMGSWLWRCADMMVDAAWADKVIFAPIASGGSSIEQWVDGELRLNLLATWLRMVALNARPGRVLWQQGETNRGQPTAYYQDKLTTLILNFRAAIGWEIPWFIAYSTYGDGAPSPTIRAAVANVVASVPNVFIGADTDTLGLEYRQPDLVHLLATGSQANAVMWFNAIRAAIPVLPVS